MRRDYKLLLEGFVDSILSDFNLQTNKIKTFLESYHSEISPLKNKSNLLDYKLQTI
jgi:hypothetical protein